MQKYPDIDAHLEMLRKAVSCRELNDTCLVASAKKHFIATLGIETTIATTEGGVTCEQSKITISDETKEEMAKKRWSNKFRECRILKCA